MPPSEDHCCKGDVPTATRHVFIETANLADREEGPTKAGDQPTEYHSDIPDAIHVHTQGVGSLGMLSDSSGPQTPAGEK
ncbi:hypothetical protein BMS3Bbin02_01879 [bacterium BMS3Bbin02]|nr:hypothetical protein BMS3Bbin02_01879 [bacterium BMS3Bbin02]